jgi:phage gpG-like protein
MLNRFSAEFGPSGMRKLLRTLGNLQLRSTLENFENEAFGEDAWPRLAEATLATGRQDQNILAPVGVHLKNTISMQSTDVFARVFTPTPWAHVHNEGADLEGTAFGDVTIPQRTFLGITDEDEENMVLAMGEWMEEIVNG